MRHSLSPVILISNSIQYTDCQVFLTCMSDLEDYFPFYEVNSESFRRENVQEDGWRFLPLVFGWLDVWATVLCALEWNGPRIPSPFADHSRLAVHCSRPGPALSLDLCHRLGDWIRPYHSGRAVLVRVPRGHTTSVQLCRAARQWRCLAVFVSTRGRRLGKKHSQRLQTIPIARRSMSLMALNSNDPHCQAFYEFNGARIWN